MRPYSCRLSLSLSLSLYVVLEMATLFRAWSNSDGARRSGRRCAQKAVRWGGVKWAHGAGFDSELPCQHNDRNVTLGASGPSNECVVHGIGAMFLSSSEPPLQCRRTVGPLSLTVVDFLNYERNIPFSQLLFASFQCLTYLD